MTYDYFIKDHLGNVRMVLTEEQKTDQYPAATMETAQAATENTYYDNIDLTRFAKSGISGYPADPATDPNDYVAKTNGDGNNIGPSILLKVMAGDKFSVQVSSWYKKNGATPATPVSPLTALIAALAGSVSSAAPMHGTATQLINSGVLDPSAADFLSNRNAPASGKPKAFLNWVLLDEQMKLAKDAGGNIMAGGYSGADPVGDDEEFKTHVFVNMPVNKNGYLYIYTSNETPNIDVFFDNLQVTHIRGPILEETHYYPFGLTMAGISSKALAFGNPENKRKFNGVELSSKNFSDGSGLDWYETMYRNYDPQIGRFHQIDPLADLNLATYSFSLNNPILFSDPLGLDTIRGKLPKDYTPNPGDVYINRRGKEAIYDAEDGWVQSKTLQNVNVGSGSQPLTPLQSVTFFVGLTDTYYGVWENNYDHKNYITTRGRMRPLPTGRQISRQARMFKQRSNIIKNTGEGISLLSITLTAIEVRDQYLKGGINNVSPVDATGLVLGTAGLTANRLSYFGIAPRTMSAISTVAGKGSMALGAFQSMYMMFDMIYNNPEINNWRPSTGDFETDFMMQLEQSKGFYNDEDYFR